MGVSVCLLTQFLSSKFQLTKIVYNNIFDCRNNLKFQYSALDGGMTTAERTPRERATRERSYVSCQEWTEKSDGRYEIIAHLDDIGCRPNKNWFLLSDTTVRTDRLMTLIPLPADCVALEELSPSDSPKGVLMELLGSLQHPYIYPVLDLGVFYSTQIHYACLVMPFNARGSLKDLIYKVNLPKLIILCDEICLIKAPFKFSFTVAME